MVTHRSNCAEELTGLRGEVTVDRVAGLLVGKILHGLKRRRTWRRTSTAYTYSSDVQSWESW